MSLPFFFQEHRLAPAEDLYVFGVLLWEMVHPDKKVYGEHSNTPWAIVQVNGNWHDDL